MPLDDPEAYGRIKDNIALLAEGAEFRLQALLEEWKCAGNEETCRQRRHRRQGTGPRPTPISR
jgi:hypothetical protein